MIEIVPYKSGWPIEFREIAGSLRQGLGDLALRIDHIGSTSVPGLDAKDIIDVQITVSVLDVRLAAAMTAIGYILPERIWLDHRPPLQVGPDADWEKWAFIELAGQRLTNTHVRVQGRANQRYALLFRDCLSPSGHS
jgi:GrpB-like predicted nucleotidyltransferase (UPF0157 family)